MKAEIIAVGNEMVTGKTINTNGAYIARWLENIGIETTWQNVVLEDFKAICEGLEAALKRAEIIIFTGGLDSASNHLTKESVCHYLKKEGIILPNHCGTSPGLILEENGHMIILLPGQPKEMQAMLDESVRSYLKKKEKSYEKGLEPSIIGYNEDKIEEKVLETLKKRHYSISTVESCTGGLLAGTIVNCSGISSYFQEGIVTYSNEAKMKYVGVQEETLALYGAVSEQTAIEMAEGIKKASGADIGLSTTGIAGPDGGTKQKPVGLVYIGIALPDKTYVYELHLKGTRQQVRTKTVNRILFELYQKIK